MRKREELLITKGWDVLAFKAITAAINYTPLTSEIKRIIYKHWHMVTEIPGSRT